MTTLLYTHPACLEHDPGSYHPECPDRLRAVMAALDAEEFAALERREAPRADLADIARVHPRQYIDAVLAAVPASGHAGLDADTVLSPGSGEAALRAAGAVCAAVDAVMAGEGDNAFCAVRPPGHHAEPARPMGFCLFNNVAIGAARARAAHGIARAAVVDFDVHHGNGTQAMFAADPTLFYASTHQSPLYPGTGGREERGVGNIVNVPLQPMSGSAQFRAAFEDIILPALEAFRPEFLFISAGFDAHRRDPLAQLELGEEDFAWVTRRLAECARRHCAGRLVSALEGGYDLAALGASAAAHLRTLMAA
ncbi:MAG TPA: histone deacetylase family protein [Stellaceae bacterium]|nr:histone deacetylase family protein [Stellaceae bacterium]